MTGKRRRTAMKTQRRRRKLISSEQATVVAKQPTRPCSDCPWARDALPGWLGSGTVEEWVAVAHGEAAADCHALKGSDGEHHQCVGLAIYRANVAKLCRDPDAIRLPADREKVFASPREFIKHHQREEEQE
jgi:hypothetical protein